MNNQEAINVMEKYTDIGVSRVVSRAHIMAISALKKQIPENVIDNIPVKNPREDSWYQCPACGCDLTKIRSRCCPWCGQKLSWEEKKK